MYAVSGLRDGSLQNQFWESNEARVYAGRQGDRAGEAFERKVAEALQAVGLRATPRRSIPGLLNEHVEEDLGDIDVFALSSDGRTALLMEAKNLRVCRTEAEVAARMTKYRGRMVARGDREEPDKLLKHLRRIAYVRDHADRLAEQLGLPNAPQIRGLMVFDAPQPMNFHRLDDIADAESCMLDNLIDVVVRG